MHVLTYVFYIVFINFGRTNMFRKSKTVLLASLLALICCVGFASAVEDSNMDSSIEAADEGSLDNIAVENDDELSTVEVEGEADTLCVSNDEVLAADSDQSDLGSVQATGTRTITIECPKEFRYEDRYLNIYTSYNAHGKMTVGIDGKPCHVYWDNPDSYASKPAKTFYQITVPKLDVGTHTVHIAFEGDSRYAPRTLDCQLSVYPKFHVYDGSYAVKGGSYHNSPTGVGLKVPTYEEGKVVVKFYNTKNKLVKTVSKKIVEGKAYVSFYANKVAAGKYKKVVVKYSGKNFKVKTLTLKKVIILPKIKLPHLMLQGGKKYISVKKAPCKRGVMKIFMGIKLKNGKYKAKAYSKRFTNGKVRFSLSKVRAGVLNSLVFVEKLKNGKKVTYRYNPALEVLKSVMVRSIDYFGKIGVDINTYKSGGKPLANKYVSIKVNGKFVKKVKTDRNGHALFLMSSNFGPGSYKVTATYKKCSDTERVKI